jgi:ABC-2 type transport system ATP-binding protein
MTLFLSTHQLSVAEEVADRIAIIHLGRIIACGTVAELRAQSGEGGALEKVFLSLIDQQSSARAA